MKAATCLIGFGEAGRAFARPGMHAFDLKTGSSALRASKLEDYRSASVHGHDSASDALKGARAALSLVTADQALAAAQDCALDIEAGCLWFDMNSVAPGTKSMAAGAIEAVGGRYVDVAILAPVHPAGLDVPLLVSGPHSAVAEAVLREIGFSHVANAGQRVGQASAIKMIRSVMVKGIEALTAECFLAADRAGVSEVIAASLDASWSEQAWAERADYNLGRMLAHGLRRSAEMEEVAKTLGELGIEPVMTRGTIVRQRELGALSITPPHGLAEKLAAIDTNPKDDAA